MQSSKFIRIAKDIAKNDKTMFETLMEFEKTKKIRTKTRMNFTVDKAVASRFQKLCREKGYNMSARIEQSMRKEFDSVS
ncbi:MAG: hypothetical protein V1866_00955 [archaeon]